MIASKIFFRSLFLFVFLVSALTAQDVKQNKFWRVSNRQSIVWNLTDKQHILHSDNIEMAGKKVAGIIYYTINKDRDLKLERDIIFPQLRTFNKSDEPDYKDYRAYYRHTYGAEFEPNIYHNKKMLSLNKVDSVEIAGKLIFYHSPVQGIRLTRTLHPSMTERLFVEKWQLENISNSEQVLFIGNTDYKTSEIGHKGEYHIHTYSDAQSEIKLSSGESYSFAIYFSSGIDNESLEGFNLDQVEKGRDDFLSKMKENLILQTPNEVLNTLFYFSKIRAAENIFDSKMGIVHSPGGGSYYTGIWANDQVEYSGPFFPFLGYRDGNEAAYNCYRMFLKNIPDNFQPISSSFEIDGDLPCCGKDRGDAAMIAYGTSQYALLLGDKDKAFDLWPLIEWSLEYCKRRLNQQGVVMSETDEMEGRIATGNANLATSSLYYGGLKFASYLADELGYKSKSKDYLKRHKEMGIAIDKYFGHVLEGLETYRYFDRNETLRHWICLPLVMGINNRAEGTTDALLNKLWTENGVLVEYNPESKSTPVFWDRGTLYALRGILKSGALDKSFDKLLAFSHKRLLEDHVPYVVEAFPENDMRHLSAESALYCRIFIEGLLGFEQTGFNTFEITPQIPDGFKEYSFDNMHIANNTIAIKLKEEGNSIRLIVFKDNLLIMNKVVKPREKVSVKLKK